MQYILLSALSPSTTHASFSPHHTCAHDVQVLTMDDGSEDEFLIPLMDMINHRRSAMQCCAVQQPRMQAAQQPCSRATMHCSSTHAVEQPCSAAAPSRQHSNHAVEQPCSAAAPMHHSRFGGFWHLIHPIYASDVVHSKTTEHYVRAARWGGSVTTVGMLQCWRPCVGLVR